MTEHAIPSVRRSTTHPLLRPFPLAVMTLATFLVVFTLLMARLTAGADPAVHGAVGVVTSAREGRSIVTRTSGGAVTRTVVAGEGEGEGQAGPAVATRSSGATGGRDD